MGMQFRAAMSRGPFLLFHSTLALIGVLAGGCASERVFTITAVPPDASITIDGIARGKGPIEARLNTGGGRVHTVLVSRLGYSDRLITISDATEATQLRVDLQPRTRTVTFEVRPLPAIIKVDGKPLSDGAAVTRASAELTFTVDAKDDWVPHVVTAERPGYRSTERLIRFTDASDNYVLPLEPQRKDVVISTDPPGATVEVNGQAVGQSPARLNGFVIGADPQTNEDMRHRIRATKPGFEPAEGVLSWDEGRSDYVLKLGVKSKTIRLITDPPDAVVRLRDRALPRDAAGFVSTSLEFRPVNDAGDLPTHELTVSPPDGAGELEAARLPIGWDDGRADYSIELKASTVMELPLLRPEWTADGVRPAIIATVAPLRTEERPGVRVVKVVDSPQGGTIDFLASSPDGASLAYSVLATAGEAFRAHAAVSSVDAAPPASPQAAQDVGPTGRIVLMPSFAPDGADVLFADGGEDGKSFSVFRAPSDGAGMPERLTTGAPSDFWPTLDSAPQPRLYVRAVGEAGGLGRITAVDVSDGGKRIDLRHAGDQPRVSPLADAVVFTRRDPKTGLRDIFLARDGADQPLNLTDSPDEDDFDPAWSKDGAKLAFTSNRKLPPGLAAKPGEPSGDLNIWVLDDLPKAAADKPRRPRRVTANPAWDDNPAFNGDGTAIYFRSNRGGKWAVWMVDLK